jgi:hypothetical protein
MSSKVISVLGAVAVGLAFLAGATQGCGSSGSSSADLCDRTCQKTVQCFPGIVTLEACKSLCTQNSPGANGKTCTNEAAILAKSNECLGKATCPEFQACGETIPDCQTGPTGTAGTGSTGAGGTTGTAGSGSTGAAGFTFDGGLLGSAGSAGNTCATACAKADTCCNAVPQAGGQCTFKASCDGAGANQSQAVQLCNSFLSGVVALPNAPAACK